MYFCGMNVRNDSSNPGVTVVIPVYNRAGQVRGTVTDIVLQTRPPEAIVLVDNASTDNTAQVLEALAAEAASRGIPCKVLSEPEPGAPAARNRGLAAVETEWVMFFDSDDNMLAGHIERAMRCAADNPDAEIIGWDVVWRDVSGKVRVMPFEYKDVEYHNLMHGTLATQRYMARTSLVRGAGAWNNRMRIWDDIELGARLLKSGPEIVKANGKPQVIVNGQVDSISGDRFSSRQGLYSAPLQAIAESLGAGRLKWVLLKAMILAGDFAREGAGAEATSCRTAVIAAAQNRRQRMLLKFAYFYQSHGGRATARLLRHLI